MASRPRGDPAEAPELRRGRHEGLFGQQLVRGLVGGPQNAVELQVGLRLPVLPALRGHASSPHEHEIEKV